MISITRHHGRLELRGIHFATTNYSVERNLWCAFTPTKTILWLLLQINMNCTLNFLETSTWNEVVFAFVLDGWEWINEMVHLLRAKTKLFFDVYLFDLFAFAFDRCEWTLTRRRSVWVPRSPCPSWWRSNPSVPVPSPPSRSPRTRLCAVGTPPPSSVPWKRVMVFSYIQLNSVGTLHQNVSDCDCEVINKWV